MHATYSQPQAVGQTLADRGSTIDLEHDDAIDPAPRWLAVARLGSLRTAGGGFSIWMQLRGRTRIVAREGSFHLAPGEWLALDRDSAPELQAGRHGATLGVLFPADASGRGRGELLPGHGRMSMRDLRIALRLWRNGADAVRGRTGADAVRGRTGADAVRGRTGADAVRGRTSEGTAFRALQSMLLHLSALQRELDGGISRCPGRSVRRKRQVFGRLQRARLFLEGHRHRVVRLTELAELTSFSSWYLSKTFHDIYEESPQAASVRLRLERACELLAGSDCSISEVGAACGFENSCSFARAFRTRYRTTATAYRESVRAGAKVGTGTSPGAQSQRSPRNVMLSSL
jgi:AraC family transcriptional regulator